MPAYVDHAWQVRRDDIRLELDDLEEQRRDDCRRDEHGRRLEDGLRMGYGTDEQQYGIADRQAESKDAVNQHRLEIGLVSTDGLAIGLDVTVGVRLCLVHDTPAARVARCESPLPRGKHLNLEHLRLRALPTRATANSPTKGRQDANDTRAQAQPPMPIYRLQKGETIVQKV